MDRSQAAAAVFDKCANIYQDKFMDVSLYGDTLDLFCKAIDKQDASILDIACGPGNISSYLLGKRPDFKLLGIDLSPSMLVLAGLNNPGAEFRLMDCRHISSLAMQFDGIMCGFCLPYLSKAEAIQLIRDAAKLLSAGGVLYLSTMEDDNTKSCYQKASTGDEVYMNYHEAEYLLDALKENGFELKDIQRKEYVGGNGLAVVDLVLMARLDS